VDVRLRKEFSTFETIIDKCSNTKDYKLGVDGILLHKKIIFLPNVQDLKRIILHEMHNAPYAGHPGYQKTVAVVKSQ
jgi:hypothetical protein